jgi:hypothetical protein
MRGFDRETHVWYENVYKMLSANPRLQNNAWYAKVLLYYGLERLFEVDLDKARALLEASAQIGRSLNDEVTQGAALCFLAIDENTGFEANRALMQESLRLLQHAEDSWWIAENLH